MKLQKRERILLSAAAGAIALAGLTIFFMTGDSYSDDYLRTERDRLTGEVLKKETAKKAAEEDARRLADWQRRSLPGDPAIARSLYQGWLRELCNRSGLRGLVLHSEESEPRRDVDKQIVYTRIPFSVRAHGNLDDIVAFMHGFYSAGHLQQIRRLEIKPIPNSKDFDLHISIEAISLPDAVAKDRLSTEAGRGLRLAQLSAYRDEIGKRNFFAVYVPPPPAPPPTVSRSIDPPKPPAFDFARFAVVTGFIEVDKTWEVWLQDRISGKGKTWQLREGDQFKIGSAIGRIRQIDPNGRVIVEFEGKLRVLHAGDSLRGGDEWKE
jgi:hypothetical protein